MATLQEVWNNVDADADLLSGGIVAKTLEETQLTIPANGRTGPPTLMDLLSVALQNNAAIDVIERLAALQRDQLARASEIDFNEAMSRVQSEIKRIAPDLDNSQTKSKYASYAAIDRVVRPIYAKEGFSLSFDTADCPIADHVRVVCYVALRAHTRRYQVDMPADGKGAKGGDVMTKTHATGAAMAYGMRYLVKFIFNIAVGAEDSDGNDAYSNGELAEQLEELARCETIAGLDAAFKAAATKALDAKNINAYTALKEAKNRRKGQI